MPKASSRSVRVFYPRYDRLQVMEAVAKGLPKLKEALPVKLLVLFGSYARGNYTVASDVDLLVVYRGSRREDAYSTVRRAMELPGLEPHVYPEEEYAQSKKTLDAIVAKGMLIYQEGGIIRRSQPARRTWRRGLRWMGNGLMGIGVFVLLTAGAYYTYTYYSLAQIESFGQTENEPQEEVIPVDSLAGEEPGPEVDESPVLASFLAGSPDGGARAPRPLASTIGDEIPWEGLANWPLGIFPASRIIIPAIDVDSRIIELGIVFEEGEWQWERPKNAVGHLQGTGDPGQAGNIVMSGHISSPTRGEGQVFKRLPDIKPGDLVVLYTSARAFAYQVVAKKVVLPSEVNVLKPTTDETLTLITCVPDFIYSHRLIVTAKRVSAL